METLGKGNQLAPDAAEHARRGRARDLAIVGLTGDCRACAQDGVPATHGERRVVGEGELVQETDLI